MKLFIRFLAVLIVAILLFSSIVVVFFPGIFEKDEEITDEIDDDVIDDDDANETDDSYDESDDQNNDTDDDFIEDASRFVFIEEGTFTTCKFCPDVADIIHELYESDNYPVYYVSMVKENEKAKQRLENDYNIYAYPTVFIDGGYRVVIGKKDKSVYKERIKESYDRDRTNLIVNISAGYDENTETIEVEGYVKNIDNSSYTGSLKVYITEIVSTSYRDDAGDAYHFAFVDFLIKEDISMNAGEKVNFSKDLDSSSLDAENLRIFAVVSDADSNEKFSDPASQGGSDEYSFDAYYVNAVAATYVVEGGNTPPAVGINIPTDGKIHFRGNPLFDFKIKNTIIIGKTTVKVNAEDDSSIEKVEFYIDDQLIDTDNKAEYEFTVKKIGLFKNIVRKHTIKVIAYDDTGKTAEDSMDIIAVFL